MESLVDGVGRDGGLADFFAIDPDIGPGADKELEPGFAKFYVAFEGFAWADFDRVAAHGVEWGVFEGKGNATSGEGMEQGGFAQELIFPVDLRRRGRGQMQLPFS